MAFLAGLPRVELTAETVRVLARRAVSRAGQTPRLRVAFLASEQEREQMSAAFGAPFDLRIARQSEVEATLRLLAGDADAFGKLAAPSCVRFRSKTRLWGQFAALFRSARPSVTLTIKHNHYVTETLK